MRRKEFFGGVAVLSASVLVAAGMIAFGPVQDPPTQDAAQAAWDEFMTPGPEHKKLARRVGEWALTVRMWPYPGAEVVESTATSVVEPLFDGRYFVEKATGDFMGMTFEGGGVFGFDKIKKKYVGCWVDNMGTGIMYHEGTASDPNGDVLTFIAEHPDPVSGTYKKARSVERRVNDDRYIMQSFEKAPDGTEFKSFEIIYERVKKEVGAN